VGVERALATITASWEAVAPGYPLRPEIRAWNLALTYTRPDLVRRRSIVFSRWLVNIDNVRAWFIADVIRYYVAHPEHRAAIGTESQYERLYRVLTEPPNVR
jgi:hypothetical protein